MLYKRRSGWSGAAHPYIHILEGESGTRPKHQQSSAQQMTIRVFTYCQSQQLAIGLDPSRPDLIVNQVAIPYGGTFQYVLVVSPLPRLCLIRQHGQEKLSLAYSFQHTPFSQSKLYRGLIPIFCMNRDHFELSTALVKGSASYLSVDICIRLNRLPKQAFLTKQY